VSELTIVEEQSWYLPATVPPADIENSLGALRQSLDEPPALED